MKRTNPEFTECLYVFETFNESNVEVQKETRCSNSKWDTYTSNHQSIFEFPDTCIKILIKRYIKGLKLVESKEFEIRDREVQSLRWYETNLKGKRRCRVFYGCFSFDPVCILSGVNKGKRFPSVTSLRSTGYGLFSTNYIDQVKRSINTVLPFRPWSTDLHPQIVWHKINE